MKRKRSNPQNPRVKQIACTVSAAALMLGVSSAATVGFNFQVDWTDAGSPGYTGKAATATAFGIPANGWENLCPLPTGYNSGTPGPYTTNEMITATSSTGGLNPLPAGAIEITWSCTAANSSGFAGYGIPYGGPSPNPGEEEVYYGFLRDEANIYTHPVGGPIPFGVTITGLASVWTNTPYAVQVIASTDTGNVITNAFVGTQATNQPVTYDVSRATIGIMGGLSTLSGPWTNDSISIWGAPAVSHDTGYAIASTIAGFIITDQPVVSMSPNPVSAAGGDTIVLSAYAVGVPPMSYQWRNNGQPIPGATALSYTNAHLAITDAGNYDLVVTNLYGAATSSVAAVNVDRIAVTPGSNFVIDSNPSVPENDGRDWGATWLASSKDASGITRTGVMSFSATATNQIVVPGHTNLDTEAGTVMFWMNAQLPTSAGPNTLFDRAASDRSPSPDGLVIFQNSDGTVTAEPSGSPGYAIQTTTSLYGWHHVAVTFDQTNLFMNIYVDGVNQNGYGGMPTWNWKAGQEIELGTSHNTNYTSFNGMLSDVRVYNQVLADSDIASVYSTSAVVNPSALVLWLQFLSPPTNGASLQWQATDVLLQSSTSVQGPYTDLPGATSPYDAAARGAMKFYRYRGHTPQTLVANPFRM